MLPKAIYELLPSGYLYAGTSSMLFLEPWLAHVGGAILFAMGALVWVLRSNYRRYDKFKKSFLRKRKVIPEPLYEFIPFLYLAVAVVIVSVVFNAPSIVLALLACYRGLQLLYKRAKYRHRGLSPSS
ncbi:MULTISPECIES: hypothetical protein [unclassified Agarivorans]|uniref:hypothetical protein n=1 Tax=unclassified Agarivorans TaxID=2636026 RepID=UPI0026E33FB2|nr:MULTISPECIES: hypothetical protein [unclassified Agarivorans]MDO6686744.1 hypothetical protein [Agarivorans sp. 3_MG-2023]MDO6716526.1 hypothetical protein [Agarivorans sp. 2_MG-2023]